MLGITFSPWLLISYASFAYVLVGSAAATALWHRDDGRRHDAYPIFKISMALLTGTGGILGLVAALASLSRIGAW